MLSYNTAPGTEVYANSMTNANFVLAVFVQEEEKLLANTSKNLNRVPYRRKNSNQSRPVPP